MDETGNRQRGKAGPAGPFESIAPRVVVVEVAGMVADHLAYTGVAPQEFACIRLRTVSW